MEAHGLIAAPLARLKRRVFGQGAARREDPQAFPAE
jgi:hypothetical protein